MPSRQCFCRRPSIPSLYIKDRRGDLHCRVACLTLYYTCSSIAYRNSKHEMRKAKLTKFELEIMGTLWSRGTASIREIQEAFPESNRPAYTTIQTTVYRLEAKQAVRRVKKVGNFHLFEATVSRDAVQRSLVDELLAFFGGSTQPMMAHLIETGKLSLDDLKEAEKTLRRLSKEEKSR